MIGRTIVHRSGVVVILLYCLFKNTCYIVIMDSEVEGTYTKKD